jgi:hypothetical protein
MSIKITLGRLATAVRSGAVNRLAELIPPGAYQFRVAKLIDAVEHEMEDYQKQERGLIMKYGVKDEAKNTVSMVGASTENAEAFNQAIAELTATETVIPYEPAVWGKLGDEAAKKLSINDVRTLGPLLVETLDAPAEPLKAV